MEFSRHCRETSSELSSAVKIELEAELAYYWSTLAFCDQAEEVLVIAADDHGCRLRSAGGLYERLGAGAIHLHPVLTHTAVFLYWELSGIGIVNPWKLATIRDVGRPYSQLRSSGRGIFF